METLTEWNRALLDVQRSLGALFADETTAPRAIHFGDPRTEYEAAKSAVALFDLGDRSQIEMRGDDRVSFLHNFCTNDVKKLLSGHGCEAFLTNVKGRILAHVFAFAADDALWIDTVAGAEESLLAHLDRYLITEDVELCGRTAELGELFLSGTNAATLLSDLGVDAVDLDRYGHTSTRSSEIRITVRRVDLIGAPGYLLSVQREHLPAFWNQMHGAGAQPAGSAAFHALRIEAGMPLYGVDLTDDNLAQEAARTGFAISFTKGCYLGQEPIARIDALGHVNRELRALKLTAGKPPFPGNSVLAPDESQEIGKITSAAVSYADESPVALALIHSKWTAADTEVAVKCEDRTVPATVFCPAT